MSELIRIQNVQAKEDFNVHIKFTDGTEKDINLEPYLHGPIFEELKKNRDLFQRVRVEDGTLAWENGADIDPDVPYSSIKPAWMESKEDAA